MRASALRTGAGCCALLLAMPLAMPPAARAQGVTGYAQGQYQVFEQSAPAADGSIVRQRTERWIQTLELQHMATPRSDLRVLSSFRLTDLAYRGLPDASHSPQGSIQVSHPWANLFAAYRPSSVTGGFGPAGVSAVGDTNRARTLTARTQEAVITGQIAPPSWPRLDLSWIRRHRNRDEISPEEMAVTRQARMAWSNQNLNLYGSLGDQRGERAGTTAFGTQRTGGVGGALHLAPIVGSSVDLSYDLTDARVGDPRRNSGSSRGHSAALNAGWRPGGPGSWTGSWFYRRTESRGPQSLTNDNHEGSLQYSYDPRGPLRLLGSLNGRTVYLPSGRGFARSASAVASLDGRVRTGWTGVASVTHITNWEPGRGAWSVEATRVTSQMMLARGLECSADAQVSTSNDTTFRNVNTNTEANARARFTPWPAFTAGWTSRLSRNGSGVLGGTGTAAHASGWDVRWRPLRTLELTGLTASTRVAGGARTQTRTASMRWAPRASLQISGDWSKSSDERTSVGSQSVSGREIATGHVLMLLSRKLQLDAAAGVADRGGPRENRQGSMTLTWAFGR